MFRRAPQGLKPLLNTLPKARLKSCPPALTGPRRRIVRRDTEHTKMHGEPDASVKSPCPRCPVVNKDVYAAAGSRQGCRVPKQTVIVCASRERLVIRCALGGRL